MAFMEDHYDRYRLIEKYRHVDLRWCGWSAPLERLLSAGWDIKVEEVQRPEFYNARRTMILGQHRSHPASFNGGIQWDDRWQFAHERGPRFDLQGYGPPFRDMAVEVELGSTIYMTMPGPPVMYSRHLDASDCSESFQQRFVNLREVFGINDPEPDLKYMIKKATMNEILTLLLEKQEPLQKEIRSKMIDDVKRRSLISLAS